jgi:hypothetical protein
VEEQVTKQRLIEVLSNIVDDRDSLPIYNRLGQEPTITEQAYEDGIVRGMDILANAIYRVLNESK